MKEIKFLPKTKESELIVPKPQPARQHFPKWFKEMPAFTGNGLQINDSGVANLTQKMCVPFSDALGLGYIQETWCDIHIDVQDNGRLNYYYSGPPEILNVRTTPDRDYDSSFYNIEFAWKVQWVPKLPKGYSVLYTHPLNREDLPFYTFSGVVDSDEFIYEAAGNHPFLIKKGFVGTIPAGTPMFQIIPFKRDDWKSFQEEHSKDLEIESNKMRKNFWGTYKKEFWNKKTFK